MSPAAHQNTAEIGGAGRTAEPLVTDGCEDDVISPTFVLLREHVAADGRRLLHVDAHRLSGAAELVELGSDDFLGPARHAPGPQAAVAFVEWADRVYDALPQPCLVIRMSHESETVRRVELGGLGHGHEALVGLAARALGADAGASAERQKGGRV